MTEISCFGAPRIDYPCIWVYKVFLKLDCNENAFFKELLNPHEYKIKKSKQNTKYKSFDISLMVNNEAHRLEIFEILKNNCAYVI